jgi:nitroimidazol reductase NimA-like FMN-containing flavoprotein (pyridoxamine 5'-phosphate oxidase superfamily)
MRRSEREIFDRAHLDEILRKAMVLFLCLRDTRAPYVVPVCFGYENRTLFVHSARSGTKIDILRAHPLVGFSACTDMMVIPGPTACDFTMRAESVAGTGRARILVDDAERARGLDLIMRHYAAGAGDEPPFYRPGPLSRTCVIAIGIESLHGKRLGEPDGAGKASR